MSPSSFLGPPDNEDDFGIDPNANRPGATRDASGKTFRESFLSDWRFYSSLVFLSGIFLIFCIGGVAVRGNPLPLLPAGAFVVALYSLWRLRTVATHRQLTVYGWLAGGGTISGLALIALIVRWL
ncbi:hypothetical protein [Amycolatopsis aidingensis]|uniref:hypothetical protein n=1 Tax=Amycolatopsis aidingensis TaxID=2842453 RepID=UPI001C0D3131|nr:hypothetical protein [Amycolatopsis aidingensis]